MQKNRFIGTICVMSIYKTPIQLDEVGLTQNGIFGLGTSYEASDIVLIQAPWDVTASYRKGTALAPQAILETSPQIDLFSQEFFDVVHEGIHYMAPDPNILKAQEQLSPQADTVIKALEAGDDLSLYPEKIAMIESVNQGCKDMIEGLYKQAEKAIEDNKLIGLVGGDHSCSLGLINALIDYIDSFGVLQLDAHMDLRESYQGFTYSHASAMHHVVQLEDISRLIQVGVRDYSQSEYQISNQSKGRIKTFYNQELQRVIFSGKSWESVCRKISNNCPDSLYISCDIDVLTPGLCPNTGTPVPGGLNYDQVVYLIQHLVSSGKQIIGFDLVEVGGKAHTVDTITASHLLYQLCGQAWLSQSDA